MSIYKFRVVIDTEEDVFRDIEIKDNQTFKQLYEAILNAFEFSGSEMGSFYMSNKEWEKGQEIVLMDMFEEGDPNSAPVMDKAVLKKFVKDPKQHILLVYDFLKMWIFYLELVEKKEAEKGKKYPSVALSFGTAPNEEDKELPDLSEGMDFDQEDLGDEIGDMFDDLDDYEEYQ